MTIIAIDAMGGDLGPPITVPSAINVLGKYPDLHLILVGDEHVLRRELQPFKYDSNRLTIQHASQHVEMHESPAQALRTKKDSSMRVAIDLVKAGKAGACVSAGNTGALMATARFVLKMLPGIDRPAIISTLPTNDKHKNMRMLDLGANVDSTAENLLQFAVMGSVIASAVDNKVNPTICLLNIGSEDIKGNELVKQAAQLISSVASLNYAGFIEGDELYNGHADVVVCDGFVGNVALKTTEGVALWVVSLIRQAFMRNWFTRMIGLVVKSILKSSLDRINPSDYNGATLIGLQGTVIKSHGGAKIPAFSHAIEEAIMGAEKNIPERIRHEVERMLKTSISPKGE